MYEETITVTNTEGLHARPASKLVEIAGKYKSNIEIVHKGRERQEHPEHHGSGRIYGRGDCPAG